MKNADKPINPEYYSNWNSNCQLQELVINNESKGLSKREYFAGLAMQGFCANPDWVKNLNQDEWYSYVHRLTSGALEIADSLLKQLETTQK